MTGINDLEARTRDAATWAASPITADFSFAFGETAAITVEVWIVLTRSAAATELSFAASCVVAVVRIAILRGCVALANNFEALRTYRAAAETCTYLSRIAWNHCGAARLLAREASAAGITRIVRIILARVLLRHWVIA